MNFLSIVLATCRLVSDLQMVCLCSVNTVTWKITYKYMLLRCVVWHRPKRGEKEWSEVRERECRFLLSQAVGMWTLWSLTAFFRESAAGLQVFTCTGKGAECSSKPSQSSLEASCTGGSPKSAEQPCQQPLIYHLTYQQTTAEIQNTTTLYLFTIKFCPVQFIHFIIYVLADNA